jgi:2-oxoglutarate dehydrogenase complex dehydrogenase (E1) component-like enzyme
LENISSNSNSNHGSKSLEKIEDYDHRKINFCISQPTTPANYFHLLRRQMLREYRKPLVVLTPKIGLRSPFYVSEISEFFEDKKFEPIIVNKYGTKKNLIFCTGQIFIEVKKAAEKFFEKNKREANLILIRVEELAPFPEKEIIEVLNKNNFTGNEKENSKSIWIQEESLNMGAFTYVQPSLNRILKKFNKNMNIDYIGRNAQCGAIGCLEDHKKEYDILIKELEEFVDKC